MARSLPSRLWRRHGRVSLRPLGKEASMMQKLLTEFVGTLLFLFAISAAVLTGTPMAPLAIGCALMVMVYMGGHVSGAHYNPAVSLAILIRGKMPATELIAYWIAQILGALVGCFLASLA